MKEFYIVVLTLIIWSVVIADKYIPINKEFNMQTLIVVMLFCTLAIVSSIKE